MAPPGACPAASGPSPNGGGPFARLLQGFAHRLRPAAPPENFWPVRYGV